MGAEWEADLVENFEYRVESRFCANRRLSLEKCRKKAMYLPWKCGAEKQAFDDCERDEIMRHMKMANEVLARVKARNAEIEAIKAEARASQRS